MPSSYTPNYQLSQWEAADQVKRTDFNADNAKLDAALAGKGNCQIAWGSYQGTGWYGQEHPNTLTFPFQPKLVIFCNERACSPHQYAIAVQGQTMFCHFSCNTDSYANICTWTENSLSWYSTSNSQNQFNNSGTQFFYVALG